MFSLIKDIENYHFGLKNFSDTSLYLNVWIFTFLRLPKAGHRKLSHRTVIVFNPLESPGLSLMVDHFIIQYYIVGCKSQRN